MKNHITSKKNIRGISTHSTRQGILPLSCLVGLIALLLLGINSGVFVIPANITEGVQQKLTGAISFYAEPKPEWSLINGNN